MNIRRIRFRDIEQVPFLNLKQQFKKDFAGSSPAPFIGRFGYPHVNIGLLSPQIPGDTSHYDSPSLWSRTNAPIGTIASMRYGLVNSRVKSNVKGLNQEHGQRGRMLGIIQEVGMAARPVELEVSLQKIPALDFKPEKEIIPFGPAAPVQKARITANPRVDARVENVVRDTDLKAAPALLSLYQKGFEENVLTKLISTGNLGMEKNRKLVPTRWSITAVDDTVGKKLIAEIKEFSVGEYRAFFGGGWGNYYLLLFFPEVWSYELFEMYINYKINPWSKAGLLYSTDFENYGGRKEYAEETAGGYYACRIGIAEKMKELKRQHSCVALRCITSEYNVPLGVWVCREATRKSLSRPGISFSTEKELLSYAQTIIKTTFNVDISVLLSRSRLLNEKKEQRKLGSFL